MNLDKLYERAAGNVNQIFYQPLAQRIIKEFGSVSSLLEINCGTGNLLKYLRIYSPKAQLYGIDLSQFMITLAQQKLMGKKINLTCGPVLPTPYPKSTFTEIVVVNPFFRKDEFLAILDEIYRILKIGGNAIIFDWEREANSEDIEFVIRRWSNDFPPLVRFFAFRRIIGDLKIKALSKSDVEDIVLTFGKKFSWKLNYHRILDRKVFWMLKLTKM